MGRFLRESGVCEVLDTVAAGVLGFWVTSVECNLLFFGECED